MTDQPSVVPIDAKRKRAPKPPPVDGETALDRVAAFIGRFIVFPTPHALTAVTLWVAHTWGIEAFYTTPRLILDSAEPGSGKTRVLEVGNLLVRDPEMMISATTAAIFRLLDEKPYTLLFDEVDAIFNLKNGGNYEDLRALLNSGYKRGATIARCVGDASKMRVQRFTVFAPVALAGLAGNMPSTITTRAITIHMRRRAPGETVEPFRERDAEAQAEPIKKDLARWIFSVAEQLRDARPDMPDGVVDRAAEIWEAPLAVADAAGGDWPKRAREACSFFALGSDPAALSLGIRLLSDLRDLFHKANTDRMATTDILARLHADEDAPWSDLWGKPLDSRRLAKELGKYGVGPAGFKPLGDPRAVTVKGYVTYATKDNVGLKDAWTRYLKPPTAISGNDGNDGNDAGHSGFGSEQVTDESVTGHFAITGLTCEDTAVTRVTGNPT